MSAKDESNDSNRGLIRGSSAFIFSDNYVAIRNNADCTGCGDADAVDRFHG